jgi:sortase A
MRTRRAGRRQRLVVLGVGALAVLLAGSGLLFYTLFAGDAMAVASQPGENLPPQAQPSAPTPEQGIGERVGKALDRATAPEDTSLTLTVPRMERVDAVPVYTAPASDEATLDRGALHVEGTGFPWQEGANVYIAGHRLGYKGTGSYLLFHDLDELANGDEVILTDADGKEYTYRVFRSFKVDPSANEVTRPVAGRSVVSLQTCTLPDYKQRLVVQAERVG